MAKRFLILLFFVTNALFSTKAQQTFTKTYTGTAGNIPDNGATPTCFPVTVSGLNNGGIINGTYGLASVKINITHKFDADLVITLNAPDGTSVTLSNQEGSSGHNYTNTVFTAAATTSITAGTAPFTGNFLPESTLGAVNNGQNGDGVWTICIQDVSAGTSGKLVNYTLSFDSTPAPPPIPKPTCKTNGVATGDCNLAPLVCDFQGFCGSTSSSYVPPHYWPALGSDVGGGAFCGTIEDNSFIKFVAGDTAASFHVWCFNSTTGGGIQTLFWDGGCNGATCNSYGCNSEILPGDTTIYASGLTIGNTYYLMFDGYAGDNADYTVSPQSGVSFFNITADPSVTNICKGAQVKLNVIDGSGAGGSSNVYNWTANTSPTGLNTTVGKDVIVNTNVLASGNTYVYTVTGKSTGGCPATKNDTITVIDPPVVTSGAIPSTQTVAVSATPTTLSVTSPSASVTYQWYSNVANSNTGGTIITGATASTFVPPTTAPGTTYYYCVITNTSTCTSVSNPAEVIVNGLPVCTTPDTLAFVQQPTTTPQSTAMSPAVTVKIFCKSSGLTATGYTGLVTLTAKDGCGFVSETKNSVAGIATFDSVIFTRSVQNGVSLIATAATISGSVNSDTFSIVKPTTGTKTKTDTLLNYSFTTPAASWQFTDKTDNPSFSVTKVVTLNGKTYLSKTSTNVSGDPETTDTITFKNTDISKYSNAKLNFELASLNEIGTTVTDVATGRGLDNTEDLLLQVSLDGGSTWKTVLSDSGFNNYLFDFSNTPTASLNVNTNSIYGCTVKNKTTPSLSTYTTSSAFSLPIPNGNSQFQFRIIATDNRSTENWCIGNIVLQADSITNSGVTIQSPLPTLVLGNDTTICSGSSATLHSTVTNTVGTVTYAWTPSIGFSTITDTTLSTPLVSPASNQAYNLSIVDGDKCKASAGPLTVTVNKLPVITSQSTPAQNVCVGSTLNALSVVASDALTYQWYSNTTASNSGGTLIVGATSASYTPPSATLGTTYYYCEIAGTCGPKITSAVSGAIVVGNFASLTITNPAAVCSPSTVDLTAPAITAGSTVGLTYTYWTDAGATTAYPTPTKASSGTYYIKGSAASGCTAISPVTVTVNATPTVTVTNPAAVCSPSTVDISSAAVTAGSTAGLTYTYWMDAGATIAYPTPTAATAGTYYIKGATASGCTATSPVMVTVNALPTVTITNPAAVCSPTTVDLTATAVTSGSTVGLSYTYWTNAGATIAYPTPTAATAGTYYIKGATASGCSTVSPVTVTVNSLPTVTITNPAAVCSPSTVDLTSPAITSGSTVGLTYTYWTDAGATTAYPTPTTASSGTYYIKGSATSGCTAISPVTVTVNALPTVSITNPVAVCNPSTVDLTVPAITSGSTAGLTYTYWTDAGATIAYPTPTAATAGTYYVKGTTASGCSSISPIKVTINSTPTITVQSINPGCSTVAVDLDSAITSDKTGLSFSFYADAGLTTSVTNPVVTAGTYYIKATNASGCSASASVSISTFRSYPVFITKPMKPSCGQTAVNLDTSITTSVAGLTVKYYSDSLLTNPLLNPVVTKDTTYYLTATNANGCTTATSVVVSPFKATPILTTSTVTPGCGVSSVDLDSSITSSKIGLTFDYYSDAALTSVVTNPVLLSGTYFIKATNSSGCTNSAAVNVQTFKPYPLITTSPINPICGVSTIDLSKAITSSVAGLTVKYFSDSLLTKPVANPVDSASTYFIEVTNANGCSSSTSIVVSSLKPNPVLTTTSITPACGVASVDLSTGITSSTSSLIIKYYQDAGLTTMATNPVSAAGTYYVSVLNANGCNSSASIVVGAFKPNPIITTTSITPACGASSIDLSIGITSSLAGLSVKYYSDATLTLPVANPVTAVGTYYVEVTNANGCSSSSSIVVNAFNVNPVITTQTITPACGVTSVDLLTGISSSTTGLILTYYQDAALTVVETNPVTAAGTYYVSAANANGCSGSASIVVGAFKPNPIIKTTGITPGCGVTSVDLKTAIISDTVGLTIGYYSDIALSNTVINPVSLSDTTYYIKVTNANGCWASASVIVDSFKATIPLTTQAISPKCGQTSVDLNNGITSSTTGLTITYYDNAALTIVETNPVTAAGTYYVKATSNTTGCSTSSSIVVNAFLLTPVVITKDISLACGITTANLGTGIISDTTGLSVSYYSDTAAPAKQVANPVNAAGKYYVTVVNASGCSATGKIVVDSFKLNPVVTTIPLIPACGVTSVNLDSAINSQKAGLTFIYYQDSALTVQETNPVFAAGKYYVKAISTKGCFSSDSIVVKAFRLNPTIVTHEIVSACGVDSADLSTGILSSTAGLQVSYYGDALQKDTILYPIIKTAGTYYISVTNAVGCSASASVLVDAFKFVPVAKAIIGDTTLCINLTTQLTDSVTPGKWYSLAPSIASIDTTSGLVTGKKFGDANIRYIVSNVCGADSVYHSITIVGKKPQISLAPSSPTCLYPTSGKIMFNINGTEGPYLLKYDGNYYSDSIDNLASGLYDVTIYNKYGCDVADYTNIPLSLANDVSCDTLYVPSGFAPGLAATGKNYSLKPFGGSQSNITNLTFKVYNRYGNLMFESHDLYKGWDGNFGGASQGTGTFVWYLEYKINGRMVERKGTSVLIR